MPQPDLSALKDDIGTLPLTDDFLPAVMQALHYYTEMMQYEQLQNPTAKPTFRPTTTTRRTTTTTRRTTPRTTTAQRTTQRTTQRQTTRKTTPWYVTQKTTPKTTRRPVTTTKKPSTQGFEIIPVNVIEVQRNSPNLHDRKSSKLLNSLYRFDYAATSSAWSICALTTALLAIFR